MVKDSSPLTPSDLKRLSRLRSKHKQIPIHQARKEILREYGEVQKCDNSMPVDREHFQDMAKVIEGPFKRELYGSTAHDVMYDFDRDTGRVYPCPTWEDGVNSHCRAHFKQARVGVYDVEASFNASFPPVDPNGEDLWFELRVIDGNLTDESGLYWTTAVPTLKALEAMFLKAKDIVGLNIPSDQKTLESRLDEIDLGRKRYRAGKLQLIF